MSLDRTERRGIPVSPGIAIGPAYVLRRERIVIPEHRIRAEQADFEVERLRHAFVATRHTLEEIRRSMHGTGLVGTIFDAQFLFLEDPTLIEHAEANIREQGLNAEWALQVELRRLEQLFESMPDPYIRERASDIGFVVRRVLQALMGREPEGLRNAPPGVIVVAEELSPGEVAQVTRDRVAGFVTETGSRTSHVTIMARSLEIPAVVGAGEDLVRELADGVTLILDGRTGLILVDPDALTIAEYRKHIADLAAALARADALRRPSRRDQGRSGDASARERRSDRRGARRAAPRRRGHRPVPHRVPVPEPARPARPRTSSCAAYAAILCRGRAVLGDHPHASTSAARRCRRGLDLSDEPNPALGLRGVRMSLTRARRLPHAAARAPAREPSGKLQDPAADGLEPVRGASSRAPRSRP